MQQHTLISAESNAGPPEMYHAQIQYCAGREHEDIEKERQNMDTHTPKQAHMHMEDKRK